MDLYWGMNTPGPGVEKDEPRKRGVRRFIELLLRDGKSYLMANTICLVAFLPVTVAVCFGVYSGSLQFTLLAGCGLGVPAGVALYGMYDTVLRTLRDEAGFWWPNYRRALSQNLKLSVPLAALLGGTLAMMAFAVYWNLRTNPQSGVQGWLAPAGYCVLFALLLCSMLAQAAVLDVGILQLIKNGILFVFGALPRVTLAASIAVLYWGATVLLFPYSLVFVPLLGFWFVTLLNCMILYPTLDKIYHIEETLQRRAERQSEEDPYAM